MARANLLPTVLICRLRYDMRMRLSEHPRLYLPLARRKYRSGDESRVVDNDTAIVIEGFEGSGNTFAAMAFSMSQPRAVKMAHNLHAPAQIVAATDLRIPTIVLVRDPEESALSHAIRHPCISVKRALANWIRYYELALRCRDRILVTDFTAVVSDFGSVIGKLNERFDTDFAEFEHTDANVVRCFDIIEERNRDRHGKIDIFRLPRPSSQRGKLKQALREALNDPALRALRTRGHRLHREILRSESPRMARRPARALLNAPPPERAPGSSRSATPDTPPPGRSRSRDVTTARRGPTEDREPVDPAPQR